MRYSAGFFKVWWFGFFDFFFLINFFSYTLVYIVNLNK